MYAGFGALMGSWGKEPQSMATTNIQTPENGALAAPIPIEPTPAKLVQGKVWA